MAGRASISSGVLEQERRLRGIDEFLRTFEAEHGEITEAEMDRATRDLQARAIVVRSGSIRGRE